MSKGEVRVGREGRGVVRRTEKKQNELKFRCEDWSSPSCIFNSVSHPPLPFFERR